MIQPVRQPTALLIPCPWSGDERDPIRWTYRAWFRLYKATRQLRHLAGLHDWIGSPYRRCSWCGKRADAMRKVVRLLAEGTGYQP